MKIFNTIESDKKSSTKLWKIEILNGYPISLVFTAPVTTEDIGRGSGKAQSSVGFQLEIDWRIL